ncbi:MAG: HD domain-containing protein [Deltaproteobacteria bacterium]|nr:HD domain-containing protein [Deltaproteobacteria bacterium]
MNAPRPVILRLPGRDAPFVHSAPLRRLVDVIVAAGGRPVAVGGAVRDHLLGLAPKDVDVEVSGLPLDALERAFAAAGFAVHAVGRSFGVLKVDVVVGSEREVLDVSLPRTESKEGRGHKGFVVASDPHLPFDKAAARRDFTLNAIGIDLQTGAVLDPWGGVNDLERGLLRHVSDAFDEDPLRVLRAAQFAARFGLDVDDGTLARCRSLLPELPTLARERVGEELKKLLVKGVWPSVGLAFLKGAGVVDVLFPELRVLIGCQQEHEWHPEGDVWVHSLMVTDEAARLCRQAGVDDDEAFIVILAALCHDLGKPATSEVDGGRIRSRDHEAQGEAPTRALCDRLGVAAAVSDAVVALVRDHLKPFQLWRERETLQDGAIRRLALRVPVARLVMVASADHFGRTTPEAVTRDDVAGPWLLARAQALAVKDSAPRPLLQGRDLVARGLKPGKEFGAILHAAFEAQLDGTFGDKAAADAWLDRRLRETTRP